TAPTTAETRSGSATTAAPRKPARRFARAARWVAPSLVAACVATLAGGAIDGAGVAGVLGTVATTGFLGILATPALFVASMVVRAVYAGWQPDRLAAELVEDGGGAPRLAGWVITLLLAAFGLAWAMFQSTWLLAARTAFKPIGVSFAQPIVAVGATLVLVALARPTTTLFAALLRRLDARWRRRGRASLLRPRRILAGTAVVTLGGGYLLWRLFAKPKLGPLDTSVLIAPAVALAVTWLVHVAWPRLGRARLAGGLASVAATLAAIATAMYALAARPSLTLEIWGDRPVAGFVIDTLFDLEDIRGGISIDTFRPAEQPGAAHPDIVFITIDTMRADRTPPYKGPAEMPALRGLAERGVVFDWAFASSNVTRRSIPSMAIGLHPNRVHGRVVGWALRVDPRHVLLAERLRAGGYETAGFLCCPGFWSPEVKTGLSRGLENLVIEPNGVRLARSARAWLTTRDRQTSNRPLFLWMHFIEPHNWTVGVGEPRNDEERRKWYDRALANSDGMLGEVLAAFTGRAPEQAPIVIVSADHGEALGDHGHAYHSTDLYNSQMRVPLVMAGPGIPPHRVYETVSLVDMVPTILDLAGFKPPSNLDGRSIADLARDRRPSSPNYGTAFAAMIKDRSNPGGITAFVKGNWKIIETEGAVELYDIHVDPDERTNLAFERPVILRELRALLEAMQAAGDVSPFE
ncbi:MAG: sulfatase, partial [Deltaproteobacteria bacterium]|nr:sulfatase [Deltaproteobacteria bacterium]